MLILSRKAGESIIIADDIFITVLGFKGRQVSIGIDAPDSLSIMRNEIYKKTQVEKQSQLLNSLRKCFPSLHNSFNNYF